MSHEVFESMSREVLEPTFPPCSVAWCFASARGRVWCPASARDVVGPDSARSIVAQIEKCSQVFVIFFQSLLSACMRDPCLFFLRRVVEVRCACLCTHPTPRTWLQGLDLVFATCLCYVILRIKTCLIVIDFSDIQRASRVSSSGSIHSHSFGSYFSVSCRHASRPCHPPEARCSELHPCRS